MRKFKLNALVSGCVVFAALASASLQAHAAFGLVTNNGDYTIDTGAGLVFKVLRVPASGAGTGDISSLVYNGVELQAPSTGSHIASGFSNLYSGVPAVSVSA